MHLSSCILLICKHWIVNDIIIVQLVVVKLTQTQLTMLRNRVPRNSWWYQFKHKHLESMINHANKLKYYKAQGFIINAFNLFYHMDLLFTSLGTTFLIKDSMTFFHYLPNIKFTLNKFKWKKSNNSNKLICMVVVIFHMCIFSSINILVKTQKCKKIISKILLTPWHFFLYNYFFHVWLALGVINSKPNE
jgi:hypothetical protein